VNRVKFQSAGRSSHPILGRVTEGDKEAQRWRRKTVPVFTYPDGQFWEKSSILEIVCQIAFAVMSFETGWA
jgi:hypothetical protein